MTSRHEADPREPRPTMIDTEIDGVVGIFEQLFVDAGQPINRGHLRRVVRESADAFPGEVLQLWWRWVGEGGTNLGLTCKIVDCKLDEFQSLVNDGAKLILYVPGPNPWRAVTATRGRKFRLTRAFAERPTYWGNATQLRAFTGNPGNDEAFRCVVVERFESHAHSDGTSPEADSPLDPLARLWALLRQERSDMLVLLVFALVVGLLTLAVPIATQSLIDSVAFGRFLQPVVILTLLLLVFLGFAAAIQALESYVVEIIQCRLFARVTADLAFRLPRVRTEARDGQFMPELVNRFFDIVTVQKVTAKLLMGGLTLVLNTVVGMVVLALYHPWLLGFDVVLLALVAILIFILGRGAVATSIKESKYKYATAAWLQDLARCAVTFKYDGGAEFALERADLVATEYLSARKKHFHVLMRQILFALSIQAVASAVLLGIGGWLVMQGQMTLGQLVAAELIVTVIVGAFAKLGGYMESFYDALASVDKLGILFDLPIEEQESILHRFPPRPLSLEVYDATYFSAVGMDALEALSLKVLSGERVSLRGPGSSVLLDLIFGLRNPTHGHLLIDGVPPRGLRHGIALVRDIEVFHGTISENVHLARLEISSSQVRDALEQVGLLHNLLQLPDRLETELTSGGSPLTDNQLRRLVLARAIVGRPGLLLLDGLLDALPDQEAEELMRMLCLPGQPWTLFIVTGRTVLQQQCTRVVELQQPELARVAAHQGTGQSEGVE